MKKRGFTINGANHQDKGLIIDSEKEFVLFKEEKVLLFVQICIDNLIFAD